MRTLEVLSLVTLSACGPPSNDGPLVEHPPGTLWIEPADAVDTTEPAAPGQLDYRAFYSDDQGNVREVTDETAFRIDHGDLGSFQAARFTAGTIRGGRTMVRAEAEGKTAHATL